MAYAILQAPLTETKVVEVSPGKVDLELTIEEANVLVVLTGRCLGDSATGSIYRALDHVLGSHRAPHDTYVVEQNDGTRWKRTLTLRVVES